jgi:tetratricopeptide (TPR) repeat protein
VSYILEGSVQRSGDRVRVSAQLIDARVDTHIWAQPYDRKLTDVFAIQSELAEEIANRLQATLLPAEKAAIEHPPTTDLAAYDLYTRAKRLAETITFDSLGKSNLFTAIKLLEEAVERDPKFVLAYCALARFDDQLYLLGLDRSPDRLARAGHAIATALAVDPDSGAAHLASAYHRYSGFLDYEGARLELAKARASLPNEPWVFELRGFIERRQGQYDESIQSMMQALNLDPRNVFLLQQISTSYDSLRRFPESRAMLQRARKVAPEDNITKVALAMVDLSGNADPKPARDAIEAVVRKDPGAAAEVARMWWFVGLCQRDHNATKRALQVMSPGSCRDQGLAFPNAWCQGVAAQVAGDRAGAETAFLVARGEAEKLVAQQPDYGGAWGVLGVIDAALGRKEEAIRESRRAVELLPIERDSINGELLCEYLAMAYAAVGETQAALDELEKILPLPGQLNYGELSLNPLWDPLRGDPRFARMVAALAPKNDSIDRSR